MLYAICQGLAQGFPASLYNGPLRTILEQGLLKRRVRLDPVSSPDAEIGLTTIHIPLV